MPAFFLHVSAMERIATLPTVPERLRRAFAGEQGAMRLGSVFVDLPYFAGFSAQVWRHHTGGVTFAARWGQIFHTRFTGTLGLKLIEALRRSHGFGRDDARAIAFIGGFLSHHAFDRIVHPLVRAHVERDLRAHGGHPNHWHSHCEKHQSLYWHLAHVGHDVMGTPYLRQRTQSMPPLGPVLGEMLESACLETHATTPTARELNGWLRWSRVYGWLCSSRLGRREGIRPGDEDLRRIYFDEPRFEDWIARAEACSVAALVAAEELLATESIDTAARARFLEVVPDVDISVGT